MITVSNQRLCCLDMHSCSPPARRHATITASKLDSKEQYSAGPPPDLSSSVRYSPQGFSGSWW